MRPRAQLREDAFQVMQSKSQELFILILKSQEGSQVLILDPPASCPFWTQAAGKLQA